MKFFNTILICFIAFINISLSQENNQSQAEKEYQNAIYYISQNNLQEAKKYLEIAADKNHTEAQFSLAVMYFHGIGVDIDHNKSSQLFNITAEKRHPESMLNLGKFYLEGIGGYPKNYTEALKWFNRAAHKGEIEAIYNLGAMNIKGLGTKQNVNRAIILFEDSCKKGLQLGCDILPQAYEIKFLLKQ